MLEIWTYSQEVPIKTISRNMRPTSSEHLENFQIKKTEDQDKIKIMMILGGDTLVPVNPVLII